MLDHVTQYVHAQSIQDAVDRLHRGEGRAAVIAGGTELVACGAPGIDTLVDINGLGLGYVRDTQEGIRLGACATLQQLADSLLLDSYLQGVVARTARGCTGRLLRNAATVGGNLVSKDSGWDLVAVLLALDASVELVGPSGTRRLEVEAFLARRDEHLTPGHVITEVVLPPPEPRTACAFEKLARSALDAGIVTATVRVTVRDGRMAEARVVLGCIGDRPLRSRYAESMLNGKPPTPEAVDAATRGLAESLQTHDDIRASAEYRSAMAVVVARRALHAALDLPQTP